MNWRRGVVLALINLAIALPLILMAEWRETAYVRNQESYATKPTAPSVATSSSQDKGVLFDWCHMIGELSTQERVLFGANIPALTLAGWQLPCPARWTLAGMLHMNGWPRNRASLLTQKKVDAGLILLIAIQWYFVGAFPLKGPRSWREPCMFITVCSAIAFVLSFVPPIEWLAGIPALLAMIAWLMLFAFIAWKIRRFVWSRFVDRQAPSAA